MHPGPAAPGVGTFAQLEADLRKIIMTPGESLRAIDDFDMELAKSARWPDPKNAPRIPSPVQTTTDVFDEIAVTIVAVALADAGTPRDSDAKRAVVAAAQARARRAGIAAAKYRGLAAGYAVFVELTDCADHVAIVAAFMGGADPWGASDV